MTSGHDEPSPARSALQDLVLKDGLLRRGTFFPRRHPPPAVELCLLRSRQLLLHDRDEVHVVWLIINAHRFHLVEPALRLDGVGDVIHPLLLRDAGGEDDVDVLPPRRSFVDRVEGGLAELVRYFLHLPRQSQQRALRALHLHALAKDAANDHELARLLDAALEDVRRRGERENRTDRKRDARGESICVRKCT